MKRSDLADKYLKNLNGIEIGGSCHNAFGLNTINVDYTDDLNTGFKKYEIEHCNGNPMPVDVVANGDDLPFNDEEFDFVINSHVLEHFYNPIKAINEWLRVIKKGGYIFMIIPHKDRTFDKDRPLTTIEEILERQQKNITIDLHSHYSVWNTEKFLELCNYFNFNVVDYQDIDDKVGNGFTIVLKKI